MAHQFDRGFQIKAAATLWFDPEFFERVQDILDPSFFEGEGLSWIIQKTIEFHATYNAAPTLLFFKEELKNEHSEPLKESIKRHLKKVWSCRNSTDLKFVKERFLAFCKQEKVKAVILESVDLLDSEEYETIQSLMDEALRAGAEKNTAHDYFEDVMDRMEGVARDTVPTGFDVLDEVVLDGGLGGGEIGVIMGVSGTGKTWILCGIGANAVRKGYNVLHYTLELSDKQTGFRYDSIFSGYAPTEIQDNREEVIEIINELPGNLLIHQYSTKGASTETLRADIKRIRKLKWDPDLILIDYPDLLRSVGRQRSDNKYETMGSIYEDLRGLSGDFGAGVWAPTQTRRSATGNEVIRQDEIADSWKKVMTADVIISMSRTDDDKMKDTARFTANKSRFGPDGMTFPAKMSTATGTFELFDPNSAEGKKLLRDIRKASTRRKKEKISEEWQTFNANREKDKGQFSAIDF